MPNSELHEIDDYHLNQCHREASENYIAATQSGQNQEQIIEHLDAAEAAGKRAFVLAKNTLQRASEYNFLLAVYGLRVLVELEFQSVVTRMATETVDTQPNLEVPHG